MLFVKTGGGRLDHGAIDWGRLDGVLLHDLFQARVADRGDALAVVDGDVALSYRELDSLSDRIAAALLDRGAGPGELIGICLPRSYWVVASILGVLKAGCAYVPLDPSNPPGRLAFMLEDAGLRLVLASDAEGVRQALPAAADAIVALTDLPPSRPATSRGAPDDLAYVMYTSGSTGVPKGVCISHRNVAALFAGAAVAGDVFDFGVDDVWTLYHSYGFDFSVWEMWGALLHGGCIVVVPEEAAISPAAFLELVRSRAVTVLNQVPSAFRYLVRECEASRSAPETLRYVIFGGEALDVEAARTFLLLAPEPKPRLVNMYGLTENTVTATFIELSPGSLAARGAGSPIGRAMPHLNVEVLDPSFGPVGAGEIGEIFVGGRGLARGYLNRPDLDRERFVELRGRRFYRTGDLARVGPDGALEFRGRIDDQVSLRGYRIELGEVESAVRSHDAVDQVTAIVSPDGVGEPALVAVYTLAAGSDEPSPAELRRHVGLALPRYMVPARFVRLPSIPVTSSGKVDRRRLGTLTASPPHATRLGAERPA